jgi:hypothetical protein
LALWRASTVGCRLLKEWDGGRAPVFFDFGQDGASELWCMLPSGIGAEEAYVGRLSRSLFVAMHLAHEGARDFGELMATLFELVSLDAEHRQERRLQQANQLASQRLWVEAALRQRAFRGVRGRRRF